LDESLGDSGKIFGVRKTVCASPSLGFGLVTDQVINVREGFLELATKKLSNGREQRLRRRSGEIIHVRSHPAEGQEVTLDVKGLGGIGEGGDIW
jgi:hypothetical protein